MSLRRRLAAVLVLIIGSTIVSGCSQLPFHDDSYKTEIPAALEAADLGITDAWAETTLSGFTETLVVGGTIEPTAVVGNEVSPAFVQRVITVALAHRSLPMSYLELALSVSRDKFVDVDTALVSLGASPRGDGSITMADAEKIARGGSR